MICHQCQYHNTVYAWCDKDDDDDDDDDYVDVVVVLVVVISSSSFFLLLLLRLLLSAILIPVLDIACYRYFHANLYRAEEETSGCRSSSCSRRPKR